MYQAFRVTLVSVGVLFLAFPSTSVGQSTSLKIEEEREAALKDFDITEVPDLDEIRSIAATEFSKPIESQNVDTIKKLTREANRAANLINYIYEEYNDYGRENHRYEFVQEKLQPAAAQYGKIFNEFLGIRNQAYFNLGIVSRDSGETMKTFLYFRDAFRLSVFNCGAVNSPESCMRWKAEQELQKLLGLSSIRAYVSWQ